MPVDPINLAIMKQLRDGRKFAKDIADELGVSLNTVRRRIEKLKKAGTLSVTGLVDPSTLPEHQLVIIGINFQSRDLRQRAEDVCALKGVVSAGVCTGRYDVMVLVMLNNEHDLLNFHTEELSKIGDVTFSETYVMYSTVKWGVPYVL